jgi:nucleotide-binding universal stress UspA family protein
MGTIVVGVDGSPGSLEALRWALAEARFRGADVHVVHAWMVPLLDAVPEPWALGTPPLRPSEDEVHEHLEAAAKKVLDASEAEARSVAPGVQCQAELAEARPATALLAAAEDADLLVVGSRRPPARLGQRSVRPPRAVPGRGRAGPAAVLGSVLSRAPLAGSPRWRGKASPEGCRHEHRRHMSKHSPR